MLRLLVLIVVILLIWMALSAFLERLRRAMRPPTRPPGTHAGARPPEPLVRCESCGVRVPQSRALPAPDGGVFCSPECRQRARAGDTP